MIEKMISETNVAEPTKIQRINLSLR